MSGASINNLPRAPLAYRPSRTGNLETAKQAAEEDGFRFTELMKFANRRDYSDQDRASAHDLYVRVYLDNYAVQYTPAASLASKWSSRLFRERFGGHLHKFVEGDDDARLVSLIPTYGRVPQEELFDVDPRRFLERLRTALNERGASDADGYLILVLEAEHQMPSGHYCFHLHGIVQGEMIDVIERLRGHTAFRYTRSIPGEPKPEVCNRVEIKREPLTDLPSPLTYAFKHWTARYTDPRGRRSKRMRIRGPEFVRHLLWLDQWKPADLVLMMGMRAGRSGFVRTRLHG